MHTDIRVQHDDFDVGTILTSLRQSSLDTGAVASFVGLVRDHNSGADITQLSLEHYPGMTEKALHQIVADAGQRWSLGHCVVIHRIGTLSPGDQIVLVVTTSSHRADAFSACEYVMDKLKTEAPFWKKEVTADGARWVDSRSSDHDAAKRWET